MKTKGLHLHRLKNNPEENRFAQAWAAIEEDTLKYILCVGDPRFPPDPLPREQEVAATVIQWLGSSVGQNFLKKLGYEKKKGK